MKWLTSWRLPTAKYTAFKTQLDGAKFIYKTQLDGAKFILIFQPVNHLPAGLENPVTVRRRKPS